MNIFWLGASLAAATTFAVHTFIGTRFAVPALIAPGNGLPTATVWLNYLCWHIVTGLLLILAASLAGVAMGWLHPHVGLVCAAASAWISIWSLATTHKAGIPHFRFPASYLAGTTALLAFLGYAG